MTQRDFNQPKGIIFDLDGTLVTCSLCFQEMRQRIGCPADDDILTYVAKLEPNQQAQARQIIEQMELEDALTSSWIEGAEQFVKKAQQDQLPMAIITRNHRQASAMKVQHNQIPIDLVLTREDAPAKPDPSALLQVAQQWDIAAKEIWYIGDFLHDVQAAQNAGMLSALRYEQQIPQYADQATVTFDCYGQLREQLWD